jgi:hypothetical protein
MCAMMWRRTVTMGLVSALLLSGCTGGSTKAPTGQTVEIVAGGGSSPVATRALDLKLTGWVADLEVGRDGVVRLLTTANKGATVRLFRPDGAVQQVDLGPGLEDSSELAVADDGTLYVSHSVGSVGIVSKVSATGKVTPVVGNGRSGFTADGGAALGPASRIDGITVDRQGRLVYGELRHYSAQRQNLGLIRRVEPNGRITTIAGRSQPFPTSEEYGEAMVGSVAPPAGTKALAWALPGASQLKSLATGDDGTIYAQSERGVLALPPDGTVAPAARRRDAESAPVGDRPFAHEGDAADADPMFLQGSGIAADDRYVALPVEVPRPDNLRDVPAGFRWSGSYTPGQQALVDAAVTNAAGRSLQEVVRLVLADGSLTTAAWAVQFSALRDGWLYVLTGAEDGQLLIGRVKLPS